MPPPPSGASGHRGAAGWVPMALGTPLNTHKSVGSPAGRRPDQRYEVCFAITLVTARSGLARSVTATGRSCPQARWLAACAQLADGAEPIREASNRIGGHHYGNSRG